MILLTLGIMVIAGVSAVIILGQFSTMSDQTKILASQAEGDAASASTSAIQVQKQLTIVEKQAEALQNQTILAQRVFEASQRPYVGIEAVHYSADKSKRTMTITTDIRNFGVNPAEDVEIESHWYVDGIEAMRSDQPPKKHGVIFPGNARSLNAFFSNVDFPGLESGRIKWVISVSSTYRWTNKKYKYCEQWGYSSLNQQFATLGSCPSNP